VHRVLRIAELGGGGVERTAGGGLIVAVFATRIEPLLERFGITRVILAGLASVAIGYALFLPVDRGSGYVTAILPTMVFAGTGFALAYGPLNIAATNGVASEEQGLAGGLVITSFQFGGALVLAVVTAVNDAVGSDSSPQGVLDGFHAALVVPLIVGPSSASPSPPAACCAALRPCPSSIPTMRPTRWARSWAPAPQREHPCPDRRVAGRTAATSATRPRHSEVSTAVYVTVIRP